MTDQDTSKPSAKTAGKTAPQSRSQSKSSPRPKTTKPVGLPLVLFCSTLAAAFGGAAGWYGPKLIDPANAAPAQAITKNIGQLTTLRATLDTQSENISALQAQSIQLEQDLKASAALMARLERAEQDLTTLQEQQAQEQAIVAERLTLIEGLLSDADNPKAAPAALAQTLAELQGQIAALKLAAATAEPVVISYASTSGEALQNEDITGEPEDASSNAANGADAEAKPQALSQSSELGQDALNQPVPAEERYDFIANFPKTQMLSALAAQEQNTPKPGWLRRTLQKHVQSDDTPQINARAVINEAEALTRNGNIQAAADKLQTLNPTLRAAAYEWLGEARKLR